MAAAGHSFTREDLERMKRADIQKICKDYGVKANMKTEALIELLLDTVRSNISPLVPPPPPPPRPQPQPEATPAVTRRVSTRSRTSSRTSSGTRTRGTSGSSVVVRDTEDESQAEQSSSTQAAESVASSSRTRKAKDTQYRLGVGRPVLAGGQGARAVTRSTNIAKGKRTRVSRNVSIRPMEETIDEEPELSVTDTIPTIATSNNLPSSSSSPDPQIISRLDKLETLFNEANLKQQLEILRDLPAQITWLRNSLQQREMEIMNVRGELQACRMEVMLLRSETAKIPLLENQLRAAKENFDKARESSSSSPNKNTATRRVSIPLTESNTNALLPAPLIQPSPAKTQTPGPTETILGKRHRDSGSSIMSGVVEAGEGGTMPEKDLAKRVLRPSRKRTRTNDSVNPGQSSNPGGSSGETDARSAEPDSADESATGSSAPSTAPPVGTPPPTNHLPEYFVESVGAEPHTPKNYEHYPTDSGLLGFSFSHVASSTPRDDIFGVRAEPFSPGSALRAGVRATATTSNNGGLQPGPFGGRPVSPATPRTPARSEGLSQQFVGQYDGSPLGDLGDATDFVFQFNQAAEELSRREPTNSIPMPVNFGYNFAAAMGIPLDESPVRPTTQRTMYGTETQHDTRFGEFGREGIVGTSGWLNTGLF